LSLKLPPAFRLLAGVVLAAFAWTHDASGKVLSQSEAWPGSPDRAAGTRITGMSYYPGGQLHLENEGDPESSLRSGSLAYAYDYRMRRVVRDESGGLTPEGEAGEVSSLVFSGGTSIQEWENTQLQSAKTAGTVGVLARPGTTYVRGSNWGGGVGGVLYTLRADEGTSTYEAGFNFYNGRGDVVAKTDEYGNFTRQGGYEAFGKRTFEVGENKDRQRGNTKDEDRTGLLNEGFRYRDLETGTWLSRDPAGFVDGPNLYAYVNQNPWTKFDPLGLAPDVAEYESFDEALYDGSKEILDKGNDELKNEWASNIFQDSESGKFGYTTPYTSAREGSVSLQMDNLPEGSTFEGATHNHPFIVSDIPTHKFSIFPNMEGFSDIVMSNKLEKPIGLVAKYQYRNKTVLKKHTPEKGSSEIPNNAKVGKIEQWDPTTKSFGPEQPINYTNQELGVTGAEKIGMQGGQRLFRLPDGRKVLERDLPTEQSDKVK